MATEGAPAQEAVKEAEAQPRQTDLTRSRTRTAWMLLLPTLLVVAAVAAFPLGQTIYLSFTNERLASVRPTEWVGFENYADLIRDDTWWNAVWVTLRFTFITITAEFILGMVVALVVNSQFRARGMMRTAMLIPWAIPTVVSAQMWAWMYNDIYGVFNDLLVNRLGILDSNVAWVAQPNTALWSVAAVDIWKTTPFVALLLLAGLQVIPNDVYEAARVDGAGRIQQFFRITVPLLMPAILVTLIFRTLDALRVFDVFFVMFGARRDTQTMAIYAQDTIVASSRIGEGSAISIAIFLIIGIFVAAYVTTLRVDRT